MFPHIYIRGPIFGLLLANNAPVKLAILFIINRAYEIEKTLITKKIYFKSEKNRCGIVSTADKLLLSPQRMHKQWLLSLNSILFSRTIHITCFTHKLN